MNDRLVAHYDRTTTGGVVIARSSYFNEQGKAFARKGNHATCGNCKGGWPIYGTASDWMDDGYPMVKDRDRVLCPCGKNFVLAAGSSTAFYSDSREANQTRTPTITPIGDTYDERFQLRDGAGNAVARAYYTIQLDSGALVHGETDEQGYTKRHTTDASQSIRLYLGHRENVQ